MIIDNVKVYTEEKTFVKGGIMLDGDKIQRVYAEEEKPQFGLSTSFTQPNYINI